MSTSPHIIYNNVMWLFEEERRRAAAEHYTIARRAFKIDCKPPSAEEIVKLAEEFDKTHPEYRREWEKESMQECIAITQGLMSTDYVTHKWAVELSSYTARYCARMVYGIDTTVTATPMDIV